jgi:hypothetical protein
MRYIPLLRPASFATLPRGLAWSYVEAPRYITQRPDLPTSQFTHGMIECRELTIDECLAFDLHMVDVPSCIAPSFADPTAQQREIARRSNEGY